MADNKKYITLDTLRPALGVVKDYVDKGALTSWQRSFLEGKESEERTASYSVALAQAGVAQEFDGKAVTYNLTATVKFAGAGVDAQVTGSSANLSGVALAKSAAGQYKHSATVQPPATSTGSIATSFSVKAKYTDEYGSLEKSASVSHTRIAPMRDVCAGADTPTAAQITAGAKYLKTSIGGDYSLTITPGQYVWLCVPAFLKITGATSSGFGVPLEAAVTVAVTIGSTTVNYSCYRTSSAPQSSPMNIKLS